MRDILSNVQVLSTIVILVTIAGIASDIIRLFLYGEKPDLIRDMVLLVFAALFQKNGGTPGATGAA